MNRFEKHIISFEYLLSKDFIKQADEIYDLIQDFANPHLQKNKMVTSNFAFSYFEFSTFAFSIFEFSTFALTFWLKIIIFITNFSVRKWKIRKLTESIFNYSLQ